MTTDMRHVRAFPGTAVRYKYAGRAAGRRCSLRLRSGAVKAGSGPAAAIPERGLFWLRAFPQAFRACQPELTV